MVFIWTVIWPHEKSGAANVSVLITTYRCCLLDTVCEGLATKRGLESSGLSVDYVLQLIIICFGWKMMSREVVTSFSDEYKCSGEERETCKYAHFNYVNKSTFMHNKMLHGSIPHLFSLKKNSRKKRLFYLKQCQWSVNLLFGCWWASRCWCFIDIAFLLFLLCPISERNTGTPYPHNRNVTCEQECKHQRIRNIRSVSLNKRRWASVSPLHGQTWRGILHP